MAQPKTFVANVAIRPQPPEQPEAAAAFDAALGDAHSQTPAGSTRQLAVVLSWLDGATFVARFALKHDPYAGLTAHLVELSRDEPRQPRELVAVAQGVRSRAELAAIHELLAVAQARAAAVHAQAKARARTRWR